MVANLVQLETFYWVVKLGNFTAAATHLKTTQSTVSVRIQDLERSFGVSLFDRSQRAARVSPAGMELMRYAEQLLRLSAEMRERVSEAGSLAGTLRLGVAEVISLTWLPRFIQRIHERYPRFTLELDEALTQDLVQHLQQGSLDLVLAPGRIPGQDFAAVSLGNVEFVWMASPSLGLPQRPSRPQDLELWPIIALARESYHHASIENWFRSANATCRRVDTCKSLGVAAALAAAGLGVTLLPPRCFEHEIASGRLVVVDTIPTMPLVEFTASSSGDSLQPIVHGIAALAAETSTFHAA